MKVEVKQGKKEGFVSSLNLFFENGLRLKTDDMTFMSSDSKRAIESQFADVVAALASAGFDVVERGK